MNVLETIGYFPSLSAALALASPQPETSTGLILWLKSQETGDGGRGRKAAAAFLLSWWVGEPVNLRSAWQSWDDAHQHGAEQLMRDARADLDLDRAMLGGESIALTVR